MLDELAGGSGKVAAKDPRPGELPVEPTTRTGECWLLGRHRLVCGDSTKAETYERLLGNEKATLTWTDPPSGVSYVGKTAEALEIKNDALAPDEQ